MQLYRLLLALIAFFALFAVTAAEDTGSDPCLAEDYAEQNCARACRARARERALACTDARLSLPADGTCCAQGGYKLEGHK